MIAAVKVNRLTGLCIRSGREISAPVYRSWRAPLTCCDTLIKYTSSAGQSLQVWQSPSSTVRAAKAANRTQSVFRQRDRTFAKQQRPQTQPVRPMSPLLRLSLAILLAAVPAFASQPSFAQSGDTKNADKPA